MTEISLYSKFLHWLQSTEMFARPSKQLPGKWQLFEYFFETNGELKNLKEQQLAEFNFKWNIEFAADNQFIHANSLNLELIQNIGNGRWKLHKNFLELASNDSKTVRFQFAIEKEQLKLLKKDESGKIEFFGFFHRVS
ncbi:MAG TPA: hypothetical protein DER09_00060 [Prolixibacteraceae bacterium]|nr:hypothetical protein [Prolixibacteraceae bacterium]